MPGSHTGNRNEARTQGMRQRRLEAYVQLARLVLVERELAPLLRQATQLLFDLMDVDMVEILEHIPDDGWLMVQGTGWTDELVGDRIADNGDSPMGVASKQHKALVLTGKEEDADGGVAPRRPAHWQSHQVRSSALIHIGKPTEAWGVLAMHRCHSEAFHEEEILLIEELGAMLGQAISRQDEHNTLKNEARRAVEAKDEISALYRVSKTILEGGSLESMLQTIMEQCRDLVGASLGTVARRTRDGSLSVWWLSPESSSAPLTQRLLQATEEMLAGRLSTAPLWNNAPPGRQPGAGQDMGAALKNLLVVPILLGDKTRAFLAFANRKGGFANRDAAIASSFGTLAALAMDREDAWKEAHRQKRIVHHIADLALDTLGPIELTAVAARTLSAIEEEVGAGWGLVVSKDRHGVVYVVASDSPWSPEEKTNESEKLRRSPSLNHWARPEGGIAPPGLRIRTEGTLLGRVLDEGEGIVLDETWHADRVLPGRHPHPKNLLLVPMQTSGKILGALVLADIAAQDMREARTGAEMLLRPLAVALNVQEETRRAQLLEQQLRRAQRLEAIGRLAGGVAHDFNNLLTAIMSYTDMAMRQLDPQHPSRADLQEVLDASDRAARLTQQLLAFGRRQILSPKTIDINDIVSDMENLLRRVLGEDRDLVVALGRKVGHIEADPGQIEQVLMNLVVNAKDAMPEGGRVIIETATVHLDESYCRTHEEVTPGTYTMIAVTDQGIGMDAETMGQIFDPFFTTKAPGQGTGLGLSTVYGIVKQSGGSIWCYSEPGRGTCFKIYLPTVEGTLEPDAKARRVAEQMLGGDETLLVAEDEDAVRLALTKILEQNGYHVLSAANAAEALALAESHQGPIDLLITDVIMPGMNGRILAERMKQTRNIRVLYISGYTDNAIAHAGILDQDVCFLPKPFSRQTILETLRRVLDEPDDPGPSGN